MAGWLTSFLLGRPGYEVAFDVPPAGMQIQRAQIASVKRVLSGRLKRRVFRTEFPTITLNGTFYTAEQQDRMASLLTVSDTFLSFMVRDGFTTYLEQNFPANLGATVTLQENSATLLSAALIAAGAAGSITITGVFDNPAGTGTNYYTGGSYADATRIITLGTPLPAATAFYVTYQYKGWLVNMAEAGVTAQGGWVDVMSYSGWVLTGA